jgi:hypothetical protein
VPFWNGCCTVAIGSGLSKLLGAGSIRCGLIRQQIAVSVSAAAGSGHVEEGMSSDARPSVLVHATEELLEAYSFGRIHEPQLSWLEEHLLMCPQCQSELGDIEEYKVFMKAGLASLARERQAAPGLGSPYDRTLGHALSLSPGSECR